MEAEKIYVSAPSMCAVGCRKALELAVKWVYAADKSMKMPYKDNLQSLIHEPTFRFAVDSDTWGKMPFIIKLGNLAVHTERSVQPSDALASLRGLFEFVQWIDYCYGADYQERTFDENLVPTGKDGGGHPENQGTGKSAGPERCRDRGAAQANRADGPPDTPPKRSSIRRNAPSSRRTSRNSRPAKSTSTWTSN